jgi:mRNA-degrading endonuclease RelE of RelBE toxin-antitoxin system
VSYRIRYTEEAKDALKEVPGNYRQRLRREIEALAYEPRPPHAQPLRGDTPHRYKIRLDRWRLIYRVLEDEETIRILRIRLKTGPETYDNLDE